MSWGDEYREYVPVAQRKAMAKKHAITAAERAGRTAQPVSISGRKIAKTFWGKAWCEHLESYSDYANRLPRGRTYLRNGSVADLHITAGQLEAVVAGSEPYEVRVEIEPLKAAKWKKIRRDCANSIDSLLDLLSGRFSDGVMQRLTDRTNGLFPAPKQIQMDCSCPDWAGVCKHVAAALYGIGALLDTQPELLFVLRGVDHHELISEAVSEDNLSTALGEASADLAGEDLGTIFGIELDESKPATRKKKAAKKRQPASRKKTVKQTAKKKLAKKKPARKKKKNSRTTDQDAAKKKPTKPAIKKKSVRKKASSSVSTKKKSSTATQRKKKAVTKKTARKKAKK